MHSLPPHALSREVWRKRIERKIASEWNYHYRLLQTNNLNDGRERMIMYTNTCYQEKKSWLHSFIEFAAFSFTLPQPTAVRNGSHKRLYFSYSFLTAFLLACSVLLSTGMCS